MCRERPGANALLGTLQRLDVANVDLAQADRTQRETNAPHLLSERADDRDLLGRNRAVRGLIWRRADECEDEAAHLSDFDFVEEGGALVDLEVVAGDVLEQHRKAGIRKAGPGAKRPVEDRANQP